MLIPKVRGEKGVLALQEAIEKIQYCYHNIGNLTISIRYQKLFGILGAPIIFLGHCIYIIREKAL